MTLNKIYSSAPAFLSPFEIILRLKCVPFAMQSVRQLDDLLKWSKKRADYLWINQA